MNCTTLIKTLFSVVALILLLTSYSFGQDATHTVQPGETLFRIAEQYDVDVADIRQWNDLQSDELAVGQTLVVKKPGDGEALTHVVESKETLFSISKQYGVTIAELKSWNNLSSNNLNEGQKLLIYPSDTPQKQQQSIVTSGDSQDNDYYTVKSGDSLYEIAQQHEMSVTELKALNDLASNTIRVGQQLTVRAQASAPPSVAESVESSAQGKFIAYEIPSGNASLQALLSRFQMDRQEFQALNPDINPEQLRVGQTVTVLAPPTNQFKNPYLTDGRLQNLGSTTVSKYRKEARGTTTTNGELYNPQALTAAHPNISLGSVIFIRNEQNKKGVYVRVNDRSSGSGLKLSSMAWNILNFSGSNPTVTIYQD